MASCDGELLRLECPAGTTVSIQLVQYGRLATNPELCGSPADMRHFNYTDCMDRSALKVREAPAPSRGVPAAAEVAGVAGHQKAEMCWWSKATSLLSVVKNLIIRFSL